MSRIRLSSVAETDLRDAWLFVADDSIEAADRLLDMIRAKIEVVAQHPKLGEPRPDLIPADCRSTLAGNFVILYRAVADAIEIVRVVHAARDFRIIP
jgi:toxin ParE1/3/4